MAAVLASDEDEFSVTPSIADLNDILDSLPAFTGQPASSQWPFISLPII